VSDVREEVFQTFAHCNFLLHVWPTSSVTFSRERRLRVTENPFRPRATLPIVWSITAHVSASGCSLPAVTMARNMLIGCFGGHLSCVLPDDFVRARLKRPNMARTSGRSETSRNKKNKSTLRNSRTTVRGAAKPDASGAGDSVAEKPKGTQKLASAFPFTPNKAFEYDRDAPLAPRKGPSVKPDDPIVGATTVSGSGGPENPIPASSRCQTEARRAMSSSRPSRRIGTAPERQIRRACDE